MFRLQKEVKVNSRIPSDHNGLESTLEVIKEGNVNSISVDVEIKNANANDIQLELVGPNGKRVMLQAKSTGKANAAVAPTPLRKSYSGASMQPLHGSASKGRWRLIAKNHSNKNVSVLNSWSLNMDCKPGANCPNEVFTKNSSAETLVSNQLCRFNGTVSAMKVFVDIDHPNKKDLVVKLASPSGKSITLHDKAGTGKFVATTFDTNTTKGFSGERTNGNWKLTVQDFDGNTKVGKLRKWKLFMDYNPVDSLLGMKGMNSAAQTALNRAGINSFSTLASATPNKIKEVFESAKIEWKDINIDSLRQQAKDAIENYSVA